GFDISADVLKVSHHGSSGSSVEEFLAYADADYAVISVGKGNIYDHPEAVTLKRLQNYGMEIYRTDEQGTIVCDTDGKNISFRQERESNP
ncbi:MAG: MBL fold metallo-hydrolase, partial [Anaerotignum sp.]|nr:MBL fold metallo-hydrolase [Anaerotignum sp.]